MKHSAISSQQSAKALALASVLVASAMLALGKDDPSKAVVGEWRGTSICLVKPSACHDEEAVYGVRDDAKEPAKLSIQLGKIVNGQPEAMGTTTCSYDTRKKLLHCVFKQGYVDLTLSGDSLNGGMFLADKTQWRKIELRRVKLKYVEPIH